MKKVETTEIKATSKVTLQGKSGIWYSIEFCKTKALHDCTEKDTTDETAKLWDEVNNEVDSQITAALVDDNKIYEKKKLTNK